MQFTLGRNYHQALKSVTGPTLWWSIAWWLRASKCGPF